MSRKEKSWLIHIIVITAICLGFGIMAKSFAFLWIWFLLVFYVTGMWAPTLANERADRLSRERRRKPQNNEYNRRIKLSHNE